VPELYLKENSSDTLNNIFFSFLFRKEPLAVQQPVLLQQQQGLLQQVQVQVVERARGQPLVLLVREQEHRRYRQLLQLLFPPERCHLRVRESQ
jgi:hypothetical protein